MDELLDYLTPPAPLVAPTSWLPLTKEEQRAMIDATVWAHAAHAPQFDGVGAGRFLCSYMHSDALARELTPAFIAGEQGGGIDAIWTRNGVEYALSLKTHKGRLCRRKARSKDQTQQIQVILEMHNTRSNGNGSGAKPGKDPTRQYDYLIAFGVDPQWGLDIAVVPRATVEAHSTVAPDQIKYPIKRKHCVEYVVVNAAEFDTLRGPYLGPRTDPSTDPEAELRAHMARLFDTAINQFISTMLHGAKSWRSPKFRMR